MVAVTDRMRCPAEVGDPSRRGVLLLVVLSMLTLFVLLGSTYLVVSLRARKVATAFANKITGAASAGPTGERLVDDAMLTVVRGTTAAGGTIPAALNSGDDLLGDRYGANSIRGEVVTASSLAPGFLQVSTRNFNPAPTTATELAGRVVTIQLPGLIVSTRILRAVGVPTGPSLVIAAGPTVKGPSLSLSLISDALARASTSRERLLVVNGREFDDSGTNEPWDAFDAANPLLTRILPNPTGGLPTATVTPAPFLPPTVIIDVDNDSDGVPDSAFVDIGLPQFRDSMGRTVQPRAAVLVVDLDGRLNLNVHGDAAAFDAYDDSLFNPNTVYPREFDPSNSTYSWNDPTATTASVRGLPRGTGSAASTSVLKADVLRDSELFPKPCTAEEALKFAGPAIGGLDSSLNEAQQSEFDAAATTRPLPNVGGLEGRYGGASWEGATTLTNLGDLPRPGRRLFNDPLTGARERWTVELQTQLDPATSESHQVARSFFDHPGRYGTPPDVKDRMQVWADPATGQLLFYKPYWDENARDPTNSTWYDNEVVDDPYEIDLTPRGSRIATIRNPATGGIAINNPYTAADLEGLLRFYDPDSPRLSRRLVAINGRVASLNRLTVTTESWDTPAIVGNAWQRIIHNPFQALIEVPASKDFFPPEAIMGHRFDLNRPFHDTDFTEPNDATGQQRRQLMARHLYCLLVAIATENGLPSPLSAADARRLAQYAVNIVDFRDADSVMTLFRYDPGFTVGSSTWNPGATDLVWGCERPEVLITETYAWHDRNTDDESVGGSVRKPPADPDHDPSFDQKRRPRGAFFVELTSPWGSPAYEYDTSAPPTAPLIRPLASPRGSTNPADALRADLLDASLAPSEDTNGNGTLDAGEDRNGNGVIDPIRNRLDTPVDLEKRVGGTGDPVWRLVSVRGKVQGGTAFGVNDVSEATTNPNDSIVDPSRPGSPAAIDRIFYFCTPSGGVPLRPQLLDEVPEGVFWQSAPAGSALSLPNYRVVGTDASFTPGAGVAPANVATMVGPGNKPATLTEPLVDAGGDPYDAIVQDLDPTNTMNPDPALGGIADSWNTAIDLPLDSTPTPAALIPRNTNNQPIVQGQPFIDASNPGVPSLMINGTHDNFAVVHLQRLADPNRPWDNAVGSPAYNPYVTVDSLPVDLNVVNTVQAKPPDTPVASTPPLPAGNYDDLSAAIARQYGRPPGDLKLSTERGGRDPAGGNVVDIWSRQVLAAATDLRDAAAFRTAPVDPAPLSPLEPVPGPRRLPGGALHTLAAKPTDWASGQPYASLFWPNRPYENSLEVTLVPAASPFHLTQRHSIDDSSVAADQRFFHLAGFWEPNAPAAPWPWSAITGRSAANAASLLDFVHVRSRFANLYQSVPTGANAGILSGLGLDLYPDEQLSTWREPGRININTIVDGKGQAGEPRGAWRALFGGVDAPDDVDAIPGVVGLPSLPRWHPEVFGPPIPDPANPPAPGVTPPAAQPARGFAGIFQTIPDATPAGTQPPAPNQPPQRGSRVGGFLDNRTNATTDILCQTDRHARFRYQTMLSLSDRVTTRSNVYAIWVTIGYFDAAGAEVIPVQRNRGFFIVDRSIPVAYERGQDHNVRDAILLRRIIQ